MSFFCGDPGDVLLFAIRLFLRCRPRFDATIAAIVAHASCIIFDNGGVVGVVDDRFVHTIHGSVVEEVPVVPAATLVTAPAVAVAIVNAAVKSNMFAPISDVCKNWGQLLEMYTRAIWMDERCTRERDV